MDSGASPSIPYSTWRYRFNNTALSSATPITPSRQADLPQQGLVMPSQFAMTRITPALVRKNTPSIPSRATNMRWAEPVIADHLTRRQAITKFLADNSGTTVAPTTAAFYRYGRGMKTRIDETNVLYYQMDRIRHSSTSMLPALWGA